MTLLTPEQFAAANKAQFDTLFGLTNKAFEGMEKLLELNLQVVKSSKRASAHCARVPKSRVTGHRKLGF